MARVEGFEPPNGGFGGGWRPFPAVQGEQDKQESGGIPPVFARVES